MHTNSSVSYCTRSCLHLDVLSLIYLDSIVPTVLMPLSLLSYASVIGILSTVFLVVVMLIDGVSKVDSPGSLWSPAPTSLSPGNYGELGLAFGLFMAGVSPVVTHCSIYVDHRPSVLWPRCYSIPGKRYGRPLAIRLHDQLGLLRRHIHIHDDRRYRLSHVWQRCL